MKELILGGARSGKSRLAEQRALESELEVVYIATATVGDDEMRQRVDLHRQTRPEHWQLIEEPIELSQCLQQNAAAGRCLLVDCLTLWLSNLVHQQPDELTNQIDNLQQVIPQLPGHIIFVSNEVGMGIVPMGELSRQFQDQSGILHQRLASLCDRVTLTVAGLPMQLKPTT
ncbi:MAG: bifunctional adenosylcobinamide kinase/adenosylcobinamide-phosphate guanylyltransferase [Motiliproteus sp.]|nr:bifunctional adenosylcobinamide kinase/adenosylcobinamide-phosphate guanylyltransferase [Motiliproteus sp.]MCW9051021.1 bifunctional adenosylcobinamide kinase/adenosylcobinamide-phosphate guanylyltransferase [Motiliproteus sp.]